MYSKGGRAVTRKEQVNRQNEMICRIVVERARRDFPKDIDLIAGTGSYFRGEGDEYSDIDLLIVPCTERGKAISHSFILKGSAMIYTVPLGSSLKTWQLFRHTRWFLM